MTAVAVCVVLCALAVTAHSFPSEYQDFPWSVSPVEKAPAAYGYRERFPVFQTDEVDHTPDDNPEADQPDEHHSQKIDIGTNEMMDFHTQPARVQRSFNLSKINITEEGSKICVSYGTLIKVCFEKTAAQDKICGLRLGSILTLGCRIKDEENYLGLCYKKCSILTDNSHPLRTATNTCAKNGCNSDEEEDAGLCYPNCRPYYKGVGPVCWGYCDHFCGSDYNDLGLYCYRWWPPHSCTKPSYGRGVGTLPNAPWTKGLGCNGFGINGDGGCALIDILNYITLPYGIKCP